MPKYSTGDGGGDGSGDACELCGRETADLARATVAGATLRVCAACRSHDDAGNAPGGQSERQGDDRGERGGSAGGAGSDTARPQSRSQELANKQAKVYDAATSGSARWEEEGTNYESDRLPYLVTGYGDRATAARQDEGLTVTELAAALEADEADVLAVEDGRATTADVGGSLVRAIEDRLDVTLVDE